MNIANSHSKGMSLLQKLVTSKKEVGSVRQIKSVIISYPKDSKNYKLRGKRFIIQCITSKVEEGRMKSNDSTYSNEAMKVNILYDTINEALDTKGTDRCPDRGFKQGGVSIRYNSKDYVVIEEAMNEFETSAILYCESKG